MAENRPEELALLGRIIGGRRSSSRSQLLLQLVEPLVDLVFEIVRHVTASCSRIDVTGFQPVDRSPRLPRYIGAGASQAKGW